MTQTNIYGSYLPALKAVAAELTKLIEAYGEDEKKQTGEKPYEHLTCRLKSPASMAEKCRRKNLPVTARSALCDIWDAVGIRVVCNFIDDIYKNVNYIKSLPGCRVVEEKDYIKNVKPNGYRSYHVILKLKMPYEDPNGADPGTFFAEVQIRTIAMDSWASLEHQMKYKRDVKNPELISRELKRCADELAACDVSMQTIRDLINADNGCKL